MWILFVPYAILSMLFTVLTMILAPLLALTADDHGNLPHMLRWFQTFDANLNEGRNPSYGYTGSDWWVRTRWLWRNPGYGFDYAALGIYFLPEMWVVRKSTANTFFATCKCGAFCFEWGGAFRVKMGWKVANHWDGEGWVAGQWAAYPKIPFTFTISR